VPPQYPPTAATNAKKELRSDSQERSRVENAVSQMEMAPSEQQSIVHGDGGFSAGYGITVQRRELRGHVARGLGQEHGGVSEGAGTAMPLPQQVKH
jgi:hypothetical protein